MSIEHLYPFAGDHAIQSAIVVVEWGAPDGSGLLTADRVVDIQKTAQPQLAALGLSHSEQIHVMELQFGNSAATAQPASSLGGFKASRTSSEGTELRSLVLARERCIIQINDYTRWAQARLDIRQYLNIVLPLVGSTIPVRQINLQFNDLFWWRSSAENLEMAEVFKVNSTWLPQHVFGLKTLWHSHHGYFESHVRPCGFMQLDNVNVSRALLNGVESIQALIAHRANLVNPIWINDPCPEGHAVVEILDKFHDDNKRVLAALFTENVLRKIKLLPDHDLIDQGG